VQIETVYQYGVAALLLTALFGCTPSVGNGEEDTSGTLTVVTTIYPLQYFAERIGGERVAIIPLVEPGVDSHVFDITAHDLQVIATADVIVSNGLGMEPWLKKAIKALGDDRPRTIVETATKDSGLGQMDHYDHNETDPHIWLDPVKAIQQAELIAAAFIAIDNAGEAYYLNNLSKLRLDLQGLDQEFRSALSDCKHNKFVISHAAFGHLALRYNLQQLEISGLSHATYPSASRIAYLSDMTAQHGLRAILVEPFYHNGGFSKTLASETGLQILDAHVMGTVTLAELVDHDGYFGLMRDNIKTLHMAMECND
jgi:zinc transport system substrate-binding protein